MAAPAHRAGAMLPRGTGGRADPQPGERGRGFPAALPARWFLSGVLAGARGICTPDEAG